MSVLLWTQENSTVAVNPDPAKAPMEVTPEMLLFFTVMDVFTAVATAAMPTFPGPLIVLKETVEVA